MRFNHIATVTHIATRASIEELGFPYCLMAICRVQYGMVWPIMAHFQTQPLRKASFSLCQGGVFTNQFMSFATVATLLQRIKLLPHTAVGSFRADAPQLILLEKGPRSFIACLFVSEDQDTIHFASLYHY